MWRRLVVVPLLVFAACHSAAPNSPSTLKALDEVTLTDGQKINGRVIFEDDNVVVLGQRNGTFTLKKTEIANVSRAAGQREMEQSLAHSERLRTFNDMLAVIARQTWVSDLRQVPATVIGVGELRNIPYVSHRSGKIEFNVYGDPEHPAAVEIGLYDAAPDLETRQRMRAFMVELVTTFEDKAALRDLTLDDDSKELDGLTFDVDPPTAADSFGGWWLTIYDKAALDRARASDEELKQLAVTPAPSMAPSSDSSSWSSSDYSYSSPRSRSSSSSGSVYVRGYTRRDGTYVHPHTRSAPRRR
jgi:hypothetical protein